MYYIWSNEHGAWWMPGKWGYTNDLSEAGVYNRQEALDICHDQFGWRDGSHPDEIPVRVEDVPK